MARVIGPAVLFRLAMALSLFVLAGAAAAQDKADVPMKSMSQEEYTIYREQLEQRVREAEAQQADQPADDEDDAKKEDSSGSGYGRGYRSRMERGGRSGGSSRSGGMSRGGGGRGR